MTHELHTGGISISSYTAINIHSDFFTGSRVLHGTCIYAEACTASWGKSELRGLSYVSLAAILCFVQAPLLTHKGVPFGAELVHKLVQQLRQIAHHSVDSSSSSHGSKKQALCALMSQTSYSLVQAACGGCWYCRCSTAQQACCKRH